MTVHEILEKADGLRELLVQQEQLRADVAAVEQEQRRLTVEREQLVVAGGDGGQLTDAINETASRIRSIGKRQRATEQAIRTWKKRNHDEIVEALLDRESELMRRVRTSLVSQLQAVADELQLLGHAVNDLHRVAGDGVGPQPALSALLDPGEVLEFAAGGLSYCRAQEPVASGQPVVRGGVTPSQFVRPSVVVRGG